MERNLESILSELGISYHFYGDTKKRETFRNVTTIQQGKEEDLCYCSFEGDEAISIISKSSAGIILCKNSLKEFVDHYYLGQRNNEQLSQQSSGKQQLVFVDNPRAAFVKIINKIYDIDKRSILGNNDDSGGSGCTSSTNTSKISPTAIISQSAIIGSNCYIGNYVVIGKDCKIGNNTMISDRAVIVQKCNIGHDCLIEPGVTIGADGFAYERDPETLELERFPHIGGVSIGNKVEICANSSIARGSLSDTIIGDGTKLDALVHVAHNVVIGRNCELTAGTIIGGSTTIGDTCWMGLNSTLKNKIKIGNKVIVGAGACVIFDVPDEDIVAGVPAKTIKHKVTSDKLFLMAGQSSPPSIEKTTSVAINSMLMNNDFPDEGGRPGSAPDR
jgi:UDP-3-O-[3-hydroxymyristoyl] glucosamine N-acyltransferase